jgi:hypothetical protein
MADFSRRGEVTCLERKKWLHLGTIDRIELKGSRVWRTFPSPGNSLGAGTSNADPVRTVAIVPTATSAWGACSTIWETRGRGDLLTFT